MFINPKAKTNWNRAGVGSVGGGGAKKGSEHSGRLVLLTNDEK